MCIRALSTLRGLRGAPEVPPLCRETQSLGQQMLNTPFGVNGLNGAERIPNYAPFDANDTNERRYAKECLVWIKAVVNYMHTYQ